MAGRSQAPVHVPLVISGVFLLLLLLSSFWVFGFFWKCFYVQHVSRHHTKSWKQNIGSLFPASQQAMKLGYLYLFSQFLASYLQCWSSFSVDWPTTLGALWPGGSGEWRLPALQWSFPLAEPQEYCVHSCYLTSANKWHPDRNSAWKVLWICTKMPPLFIQNNCRGLIGAYTPKLVEVGGVMAHHSNWL